MDGEPSGPVSAVLTLVPAGSLALRRRLPLMAFVIGTVALCAESPLHATSVVSPYAVRVCTYSLGLYGTRTRPEAG